MELLMKRRVFTLQNIKGKPVLLDFCDSRRHVEELALEGFLKRLSFPVPIGVCFPEKQ